MRILIRKWGKMHSKDRHKLPTSEGLHIKGQAKKLRYLTVEKRLLLAMKRLAAVLIRRKVEFSAQMLRQIRQL